MAEICFVIMPFGGRFDEIYTQIYAPAIQSMGLEPLRADEIYDNQAIFQDIDRCIQEAAVILADVTGRNPNVNYELGAAHALKKEVIIVTAEPKDVPFDYRHIRYLAYNTEDLDWNQTLKAGIQKTLLTVLKRHRAADVSRLETAQITAPDEFQMDEEEYLSQAVAQARELDYDYQNDPHTPSHALLRCRGCFVMLDTREGPVRDWEAAVAALLSVNTLKWFGGLPYGHALRLRSVFFDLGPCHSFQVDYLYDQTVLPLYTPKEIGRALDDEFDGQIFEVSVRYLKENFDHDRFTLDGNQYYQMSGLPQTQYPVCRRKGCYVADLMSVYSTGRHTFYRLDGLLPLEELGTDHYVPQESHWLADWDQPEPRFKEGDTVKFQIKRVYEPAERGHVSHARNVSFTVLELA